MYMRREWARRLRRGRSQPGLPPLPVTGAVGVTITFSQPGSANAATANTLIPEGSEIYRIAPDGSPEKLAALKDDVVYGLAVHAGSLLAATGNRGRVYRVETAGGSGRLTDVAHLEASQGMAFAAVKDGMLVATSNSGKVFRLEDKAAANATYTSEVFDADVFSKWGRVEVRPEVAAGRGIRSVCAQRQCAESADGMERVGAGVAAGRGEGAGRAVCAVEGGAAARAERLIRWG